ncbi:MAG: CapA family protein [Clostridia bacterium]|nr:CapA family protein [Clostridia bacterium]
MPRLFFVFILLVFLTGIPGCLHGSEKDSFAQTTTKTRAAQQKKPLEISMVGDILLAASVGRVMDNYGVEYPWAATAGQLRRSDLTLGNLENSVGTSGSPQKKTYTFQAKPKTLQGLVYAGFDVVTLANNHSLDFGQTALRETMTNLKKYKINYTGAGENWTEAARPLFLERQGYKIAVLGFTRVIPDPFWAAKDNRPGLAAAYDPFPVLEAIKETRPKADLIIVNIHWGKEDAPFPEEYQPKLAKAMVDAGADIIMGHHPHVLQGIEIYKGKIIAYSLGNFVFTNRTGKPMDSMILKTWFDPLGFTRLRLDPIVLHMARPQPANLADKERILNKLRKLSTPFGTKINKNGEILLKY